MSKDKQYKEENEEIIENGAINDEATAGDEKVVGEESIDEKSELENKLVEAAEKIAVLEDKYLRQVAEFDNYRKRTMKEKAELIKNGGERTIESILPVLDDFERAISTMQKSDNASDILTGVELIYNKFVKILEQNGLQKIETEGKDFDTDFHEAIAMVPTPDQSLRGKVLDCIQTGYILNDKVIRHAKVAVGE
ncbi:MAG: nucleotide exchange factor GrpE [Bacteroidaceae bacterium]|nr:nucleotide exchange factor GrpE [Bacteroidaceae bacterium]